MKGKVTNKMNSFLAEDLRHVVSTLDTSVLNGSCVTVTGASGFVGMWFTELLLYLAREQKIELTLNLLATNFDAAKNMAPHLYDSNENVTLIDGDIKATHELPQDTEWLVHLAASPDVRVHNSRPIYASQTITQGTYAVLDCATRLSGLKCMMNVSSGYVHGFQASAQLIEEKHFKGFDPNVFSSGYAEAKRYAESLCAIFRNQFRLPIVNVRPFSFVGPYQSVDAPWAVNNFIQDVVNQRAIRVQGDGSAVRSYMYGADMAWWLLNMMLNGDSGHTYNLGSPAAVTLKQLAEKIGTISEHKTSINYSRAALYSKPSFFVPSTQQTQKDLGLELKFDLDAALSRTIEWYTQVK